MSTKIYSKNTIDITTFFGGPLGGIYMMYKNYINFGNRAAAKKLLTNGLIITAVFYGVYSFVPYDIAKKLVYVIPLIPFAVIHYYMTKTQVSEIDLHIKNGGKTFSGWSGFGIFIVSIILQLVYVMIIQSFFVSA